MPSRTSSPKPSTSTWTRSTGRSPVRTQARPTTDPGSGRAGARTSVRSSDIGGECGPQVASDRWIRCSTSRSSWPTWTSPVTSMSMSWAVGPAGPTAQDIDIEVTGLVQVGHDDREVEHRIHLSDATCGPHFPSVPGDLTDVLASIRPDPGSVGGLACGLACVLAGNLPVDLFHVEVDGLGDEVLEGIAGQRAGLAEDDDLVAQDHQRRDGLDPEGGSQLLLGLGVDLPEHQFRVVGSGLFEDRSERTARTAPRRPEVDQDGVIG